MKTPTTGRRSIFRGKDRLKPIKAYLNSSGREAFTSARNELARMVGWTPDEVSEGDTVQWVLLGRPVLVEDRDGNFSVKGGESQMGRKKGDKKGGKKQTGY